MPKRKPKDKNRSPDLPHNWIERHIERLAAFRIHDPIPLDSWDYKRSRLVGPASYEPIDRDWGGIGVGDTWGGPDTTAHFRRSLVVPESHAGDNAYLDIDMDGGETQLSINGRLWQGLDHFRNLVPLGEQAVAGAELLLEMEAFTISYPYDRRRNDERDYHTFERANLVLRDPLIEACLFDISIVFDAYMHCWETDAELEIEGFLLRHLEDACRVLGPQFRSREEVRAAAENASELLRERVLNNRHYRREGTINALAHSHLDIVYLWPIRETFRKNGRTTSNALSLLREYPDYIYSQSQPYLYEKLKEHYPVLFDEVKSMVDAGRWETVGAMYVEPDGNLLGPESWVRQILFGKRFLREELGVDSRICWLPDVFGVMHTLPQILKKGGIDYFLTAKLNIWNDTNVFPYDSFRWRGPDGSEVIAHFPPTHFAQDFNYGNLHRHWEDYREKHVAKENLFIYGWGDGGGGPTRRMVEHSRRARELPGLPKVAVSKAEPFFDRLADQRDALPVWDDELYMEGHRGTYTSKADLKKNNRKAELLYRDVEILSSLASVFGGSRIQERLNEGWKLLLLNQFHDTLPGTHVAEAVADTERDYDEVFALGYRIRGELFEYLTSRLAEPADLLVFNTLGERESLVCVEGFENVSGVRLPTGERLAVQRDGGQVFFRTVLPSMGWLALRVEHGQAPEKSPTAVFDEDEIDTRLYRVAFDKHGRLSRLYDKENDREVLSGPGNAFQVFEDDPGEKFAAWDIAYHLEEYGYPVRQTTPWRMLANGPLFARFVSTWSVLNSTIEQEMVLYAHDARIDFHTRVDWQDAKKLLKVAFPLNVRARTATYDLPFGHIERPTHRNTGWEQAKFEVSGHKWADMSEGDYGVALLNDCKYGYDAHDNVLRLSLLRSPVFPSPASDIGEHRFSYALLPHAGGWRQANVDKAGYSFNCPALVARCGPEHERSEAGLPSAYSLVQLDTDTALIEVIKQAEDGNGLILRAFDSHGSHNPVGFSLAETAGRVEETDLLEEQARPIACADGVSLRFSPYEVKTLRLELVRRQ
ncbi:MAG: glycoside hydrolase family 38 C-terminal domain-containing protein [Pseudomonadota bacterium]